MMAKRKTSVLFAILATALTACGTIRVEIRQESSPGSETAVTAAALAAENVRMGTRVAHLRATTEAENTPTATTTTTPIDLPTSTPTPSPVSDLPAPPIATAAPTPPDSTTSPAICPSGCNHSSIQAAIEGASPGDTIYIGAGTYIENIIIDKNLTLQGAGAPHTIIDGGASGIVLTIDDNAAVTVAIIDLTITNGALGIDTAPGSDVTLNNCVVTANVGRGGIVNDFAGTMTLNNCSVTDNFAEINGGGISNIGTLLTLHNTTVSNNTAISKGGGISNGVTSHSKVDLINSTVSGNQADSGGGIWSSSTGEVTLRNCTVAHNRADSKGGGILNVDGTVALKNTTVANNLSGGDCATTQEGTTSSLGHNLDGDGSCNLVGAGDLVNVDPHLGPLQDNGGPTLTHALLEGSPAIDAGDIVSCPSSDQRGALRPWDGDGDDELTCDIGAYEYKSPVANQP
jgi:hypothetical protein